MMNRAPVMTAGHHQTKCLSGFVTRVVGSSLQSVWRNAGTQHGPAISRSPAGGKVVRRGGVTCMAHPRRVARVAKQIEREIGSLMLTDPVMQIAVCPEKRAGLEDALSAIASVTEVELSNDLQVAKVYVSIYSDEQGRDQAMVSLIRLQGYVRKHVASTVRLRLCPEIRFIRDDSIERGEQVLALLERVKLQAAGKVEPPPITLPTKYGYADEDEDEDEDADLDDEDDEEVESPSSSSSRQRGKGSSRPQPSLARGGRQNASKDADEDSEDEDGFVDLDEDEDEEDGKEEGPQTGPVRRILTPLSTEGGFFGFAEPGKFMEEPSLSLGELRGGSAWEEGSGLRAGSKGKDQGRRKSKR